MAQNGKQLSNPFSTGSGGAKFESNIQASFVTLMLSGGYVPGLPNWPIAEIKLQGSVSGYATDDLIITVENPTNQQQLKLLGQVKHSIRITASDKELPEVISAAWRDFNNEKIFKKERDVIALITGPISASDSDGVNGLLEQARHTKDENEFLTQVGKAKFCSNNLRNKRDVLRKKLEIANNKPITDKEFFSFLRHFHFLGYDLAKRGSVVSSLLRSHIAQFNKEIADKIWSQIIDLVQDFNQNAGTITFDTIPEEILVHFREPVVRHIPQALSVKNVSNSAPDDSPSTDWHSHPAANKLVFCILLGSWNENNHEDIKFIESLVGESYHTWIVEVRNILHLPDSPLNFKNSVWSFKDRKGYWGIFCPRIFDNHLDSFQSLTLEVFKDDDPAFELPEGERHAALMYGKSLSLSRTLRTALAETLALLGNFYSNMPNITEGKTYNVTSKIIHGLFDDADWKRWGTMNDLLPVLAESNTGEFLNAVEKAIAKNPSPFDELFKQESSGIFGRNYMTGLLWAIEGIAWEHDYVFGASIVLAELASYDPGGNWGNRPINSLINIFLPWLPHTLASTEKRQAALKGIVNEQPKVAWKLLVELLPSTHSTTTGTRQPKWKKVIPLEWEKGVTNIEYWEQSKFCAELLVEITGFDVEQLKYLASIFDRLPHPASEQFINKLGSSECQALKENDKMLIWNAMCKLIAHHRKHSNADWALKKSSLDPFQNIANNLAPKSLKLLYKRLFSNNDYELYETEGTWEEKRIKLSNSREKAIKHLINANGLHHTVEFAINSENSRAAGIALAGMSSEEIDYYLLPRYLDSENQNLWTFISSYCLKRNSDYGWLWFDELERSGWSAKNTALLLCALPFEKNAWDRSRDILGEAEYEYWNETFADTYQSDDNTEYAFRKLLEVSRPAAVIEGIGRDLAQERKINSDIACEALLSVDSKNEAHKIDTYHLVEIIKTLQKLPTTDREKLFHIEWTYLPLLDENSDAAPVVLQHRLSSDPEFFCELIRAIYASDGSKPKNKSDSEINIARNAYRLLQKWKFVPGIRENKTFDPNQFNDWFSRMEASVTLSNHYDVAMHKLGENLINSPGEPDGLSIHSSIADTLNQKKYSELREGYEFGIYNSRGVHTIDPEGKPELALMEKYNELAEEVENEGYHRLAKTLRKVASTYQIEAKRIVESYRRTDE